MIDIDVVTRGEVSAEDSSRARERLAELDSAVPDPVLGGRVMLRYEPNPRLERPARAEAELDVNGRLICGRVAAATMPLAVGELVEQLRRRLHEFRERRAHLQRRAPSPGPGEWRHGAWTPPRPAYLERPPEERRLIRRKQFAVGSLEPLDAVEEMLDLDHDFYLFRDARTGREALVYSRDDGRIGQIGAGGEEAEPPAQDGPLEEADRHAGPITQEQAISEMDALNHRFVFFIEAGSGRGNVIYRRYDGHYGLIEPAG